MKMQVDNRSLQSLLSAAEKEASKLSTDAFNYFESVTPKRSGNARSKTKLRGDTIVADYPYAEKLDTGYSKQSPDGMTAPTEKYINEKLVPQAVRKLNNGK